MAYLKWRRLEVRPVKDGDFVRALFRRAGDYELA